MKCYEVSCMDYFDGDGGPAHTAYFGTLQQAKRVAQTAAGDSGYEAEVSRLKTSDGKAGMLAMLNGRGWCLERTVVYTCKPKK